MIYLDHNATTPCDPRVAAAMWPWLTDHVGNASSAHQAGRRAAAAVENARSEVAALLQVAPANVTFTSGATESINLAIKGIASAYAQRGRHIISSRIEHRATIDPLRSLEEAGYDVTWLSPDESGRIDPSQVEVAMRPTTSLVTLAWANNETGVIQPMAEIARRCRSRGILIHVDAAQIAGRLPIHVADVGIDALSGSSHKHGGPMGVGFLYLRQRNPRVRIQPQIEGGGHEQGIRAGTLNVPGIVGAGEAARLAATTMTCEGVDAAAGGDHIDEPARQRALRDELEHRLTVGWPDAVIFGKAADRLPNTLMIAFPPCPASTLLQGIPDIACATGSACSSTSPAPSHVLLAMGVDPAIARCAIRLSLGRTTTQADIRTAADRLLHQLRNTSAS